MTLIRNLALALVLVGAGVPALAQQRHPDNTIPPEKIEPAPLKPGTTGGTMRPPATGDAEISKPPPADAHFPTPVLPPPSSPRP